MSLRLTFILVASAMLGATPVGAQQAPSAPAPQPSPAPVLVAASAGLPDGDVEVAEAPAQSTQAPAKPRRAARVTTCRCGSDNNQ